MKGMTVCVTELEKYMCSSSYAQVSLSNLRWAQLCCLAVNVSVDDN